MKALLTGSNTLRRQIQRDVPLSPHTTFRIGGPAQYFASPRTTEDLYEIVRICRNEGLPINVIGGGSNLLVADQGVRGLVLDLSAFKEVRPAGTLVCVDAGASLASVVNKTAALGLAGLENISGIPGSIGGAAVMNAGGRYGEIGPLVDGALVITPEGELRHYGRSDLRFVYRSSNLRGNIILEVMLRLERGNAKELSAKAASIARAKIASQPYDQYSAGCIFRNPSEGTLGAGALLDRAGMKGERRGGAMFSERHANFIVNTGGATFADVTRLIEIGRRRVAERFGVTLETEVLRWAA